MGSANFWTHLRPQGRDQAVAPLSALSSWWLLAALAPIGLTVLVIASAYTLTGGQDPGFPPQFPLLMYAFANVVVLVGLYVQGVRKSGKRVRCSEPHHLPKLQLGWVQLDSGLSSGGH